MVKMGRTDRNSKTLRILQKQMEHAHGIRPAGDGTEHLHPGAEHIITGDIRGDLVRNRLSNLLHGWPRMR